MMELDQKQIKELLAYDRRINPKLHPWPRFSDRKLIFEAAEERATHVIFENGEEYKLKYDIWLDPISGNTDDVVFVSPTDGTFVPCGWFQIDQLMNERF